MSNVVHLHAPAGASMSVHRTALIGAIEQVKRVIEKSPIPIVGNIRLAAIDNNIDVAATNLDVTVSAQIKAAIVGTGLTTTVPGSTLLNILKATTADLVNMLEVDPESSELHISIGDADYSLPVISADDFPDIMPATKSKHVSIKIPGSVLWNAVDSTMNAISAEETRYYLNGVFLHSRDGKVAFTATDGHRMFIQSTAVAAPKDFAGAILPTKTVKVIHANMAKANAPAMVLIKIFTDLGIARFDYPGGSIVTKLVDGTFPDYQRVIPSEHGVRASFAARDFIKQLKAVRAAVPDATAVKLKLSANTCQLIMNVPGSGRATLPVKCVYDGEPFEIGVNGKYLGEIVNKASPDGGAVVLEATDPGSPVRFTGTAGGWTGVQMPTRV